METGLGSEFVSRFVIPFNLEKKCLTFEGFELSVGSSAWAVFSPSVRSSVANLQDSNCLQLDLVPMTRGLLYNIERMRYNLPNGEAKGLRILQHCTQSHDDPWWKKRSFNLHWIQCFAVCTLLRTIIHLRLVQVICPLQLLASYLLNQDCFRNDKDKSFTKCCSTASFDLNNS